MSQPLHETVGRYFKAHGDIYVCTHYLKRTGFFMRVVEKGQVEGMRLVDRAVGEVCDVSERAIGRTYHCIYDEPWDSMHIPHQAGCECRICQPRP